jgi:hypothetical protein
MVGLTRAKFRGPSSRFGPSSFNKMVYTEQLRNASVIELTLVANTPQLILSICYMAYNGLLTRMLAEFEWAAFGIKYQPLRVTTRKGEQRSTYRLQLPYRWSIPLIAASILLHWLYANSLYVSIYDGMVPTSWIVCRSTPSMLTKMSARRQLEVAISVRYHKRPAVLNSGNTHIFCCIYCYCCGPVYSGSCYTARRYGGSRR